MNALVQAALGEFMATLMPTMTPSLTGCEEKDETEVPLSLHAALVPLLRALSLRKLSLIQAYKKFDDIAAMVRRDYSKNILFWIY